MKKQKQRSGAWTTDDIKYLRKYYRNNPTRLLVIRLQRSANTIRKKASRLGLTKTKKYLREQLGRRV